MVRKALIFGVTGQDGAYLARYLLQKGYEVFGTSRHSNKRTFSRLHVLGIDKKITFFKVAPTDFNEVKGVIKTVNPDEVYHLSGQSSVSLSYKKPEETKMSIVDSTENILKTISCVDRQIKFFLACSSECFGKAAEPATELTPFQPLSPYAKAKVAAYELVRKYRDVAGLFACSGILFNHESPLRGENYVTRKITRAVANIKAGKQTTLILGNLEIQRDWGYALDYVEAMQIMLQNEVPTDYVIASGKTRSIRAFCDKAFALIGLNYKDYVSSDNQLIRPNEVLYSAANPSKIFLELGWRSKTSFESLLSSMVSYDINRVSKNKEK